MEDKEIRKNVDGLLKEIGDMVVEDMKKEMDERDEKPEMVVDSPRWLDVNVMSMRHDDGLKICLGLTNDGRGIYIERTQLEFLKSQIERYEDAIINKPDDPFRIEMTKLIRAYRQDRLGDPIDNPNISLGVIMKGLHERDIDVDRQEVAHGIREEPANETPEDD